MVPPTPFLPTRLDIPADQSLLLATEPIWEDDSVDFGVDVGMGGGTGGATVQGDEEDAFWATPTKASTEVMSKSSMMPGSNDAERTRSSNVATMTATSTRQSDTNAEAGPSTSRTTLHPRTAEILTRNVPAHPLTRDVLDGQEPEKPKYTGMTGRRDRRDRPADPNARPIGGKEDVRLGHRHEGERQIRGVADRKVDTGARAEKRRRDPSPVKIPALPVKRPKPRSPVKDDFYSRRVKDSDRRSSLGPKSPLMISSPLPTHSSALHTRVDRSISTSSHVGSSRSSIASSSRTARPSPLSRGNSGMELPVMSGAEEQLCRPLSGDHITNEAPLETETRAVYAEGSFRGSSALSRYLAKTHSSNHSYSSASHDSHVAEGDARATASPSHISDTPLVESRAISEQTHATVNPPIYPILPPTLSPHDTPKAATPLGRSVLALAGEAVRGIGGVLRRSLSRSSLGSSVVIATDSLEKTEAGVADPVVEAASGIADIDKVDTKTRTTPSSLASSLIRSTYGPMKEIESPLTDSHPTLRRSASDNDAESIAAGLSEKSVSCRPDLNVSAEIPRAHSDTGAADRAAPLPFNRLSDPRHVPKPTRSIPGLPPPLTRPGRPFGTTTAARALQPRSHNTASEPLANFGSAKPLSTADPSTAKRSTGPPTSLAARALARLPPPGVTSATSLARLKTSLKENERASQLAEKRARFEALSRGLEEGKRRRIDGVVPARVQSRSRVQAQGAAVNVQEKGMTKTVPIRGSTPGKASRARAEARAAYDAELFKRQEERRREEEEVQRMREEVEEEEYRLKRMETVVRARELPAIYARRV